MAVLFIVFAVLALLHFVYQSILLPSFRCRYRYKFFALRDELRSLKAKYPAEISNAAYNRVQSEINTCIRYLHSFNLIDAIRMRRENADNREFHAWVERARAQIAACPIPRVREIDEEIISLLVTVGLLNGLMGYIYMFPFIAISRRIKRSQRRTKKIAKILLSAPESRRDQFMPVLPT